MDDAATVHRVLAGPAATAAARHTIVGVDGWRDVAARQHGVVRRGTCGLTRAAVERELRSGALAPAGRRALVVTAAPPSPARDLWRVRTEVGDPMAFSGLAALLLYGVPVPHLPDRVEVCVPRHRARRVVTGARVRPVVARELARRRTVGGLPVVSVPVAIRRAAAELPPVPYADVVEHALRLRLTTEEQLRRSLGHGLVGARGYVTRWPSSARSRSRTGNGASPC